uniref:Thymidylate kinase-like domain-containing protein n=1 Tax=Trichobilharzia regenti TaxID=157069 RepID=A0AA85JJ45_TRIRE|nr:unnamed protein product [Trichobilharzia regenti]
MSESVKRGLFIVFEGAEKCGKKTQSELLQEALTQITGKSALLIHFPDTTTPIRKILAEYNDGKLQLEPHVAHLLYTANSDCMLRDYLTLLAIRLQQVPYICEG